MTASQIELASADEVRTFVDSFALTADLTNPEHVDILHAAKSKLMVLAARKFLQEARV